MSVQAMTRVWEDSRAKGAELLVMLAIANYAQEDGSGAWPAMATLARNTRLTARAVRQITRRLEEAGELRVDIAAGPGGTNLYTVTPGGVPTEPFSGGGRNVVPGGGEPPFLPPRNGGSSDPLLNRQRNDTRQDARARAVEPAGMTHAECRVAGMVRAVPGAEQVGDGEIVAHLRDVLSVLPAPPDDDALVADALRFRDYWTDRRAGPSAAGAWRSWRTAMSNWFSRPPSQAPPARARHTPPARNQPDYSGIRAVADVIRERERGVR